MRQAGCGMGLEERVASITGLRTNSSSSSRVVAYPTDCLLQHSLRIVTIQSQGSGQIEWLYKRSQDVVDALGFPARPSVEAKVPTASIWGADRRSSPLSLLSRSAWEDSTSPGGQPSAKDHGQTGGVASPLPQGSNNSATSSWASPSPGFSVDHITAWLPLLPVLPTHTLSTERQLQ